MSSAEDTMPAVGKGRWLFLLCLTLLGYALCGKGWAYVGVPPIYIGEAVLLCGVVSVPFFGRWQALLDVPASGCLLLLTAWGFFRTVPDISRYGVDALRDAVIWGYGVFAFLVFAAIAAAPAHLVFLLRSYRTFTTVFLVGTPLVWCIFRLLGDSVPRWPWSDVPVLVPKGGDIMVHVAGIIAFWVAGFCGHVGLPRVVLLAGSALLVGTFDRSGLVAFLTVFTLCLFARPRERSLWQLLALGFCGLGLLAAADIRIQMPGREREVSAAQFVANLASLTGSTRTGDLDETKEWRLQWWSDIRDYTIWGEYFWSGKGFGINLADDDGYQVEQDGSLRNPHNGHLTMLARGGMPGICLWALAQLSWAACVRGGYVRARQAEDRRWANFFLFLFAYWLAFMINAAFDVFLEGPMGGIWFWTVYGVGLAAVWVYRHCPEVLDELDETAIDRADRMTQGAHA